MVRTPGTTGTELSTTRWAVAFALVTSLFFAWGFTYGLLDVLNAHFRDIFHLTRLQTTFLQVAYFGAYLTFSPFAGLFMTRWGYKKGIHLGLGLYSLGAIFFWPSAKYAKYGGFVGCTYVIGCGLATLEVAANSYIAILGPQRYAAARLNFSHAFQGIASVAGPTIASRYFFLGNNVSSLDTVQWVYLSVAGLGLVLNVFFYFCDLPEINEDISSKVNISESKRPFWKQYRCIFGLVAQTAYVGGQVGVASFAVIYLEEQGIDASKASLMFSFCLITFTVARFINVFLLKYIDPALLLSLYSIGCSVTCLGIGLVKGNGGIACLYLLFFFESICYPCIFSLATKGLGVYAKKGSGFMVMGLGGGAWFPSAQAALGDRTDTARSYLVLVAAYLAMTLYAVGIVINQALKDGFHVRNVEALRNYHEGIESHNSVEKDTTSQEIVEKA